MVGYGLMLAEFLIVIMVLIAVVTLAPRFHFVINVSPSTLDIQLSELREGRESAINRSSLLESI